MKDNVILIGMPGSGKSTVGVVLAKILGYDFIDLDIVIAKREGMALQEIIDSRGVDEFLKCEEAAASALSCKRSVVATGGSAVLSEKGMENLKKQGTVMFFDVPFDELRGRIRNIKTRGIACKPGDTLSDVYNERIGLYKKYAQLTVNCAGKPFHDVVDEAKALVLRGLAKDR